MNATQNPIYTAYMALHLCNKTLDEIPFQDTPKEVRNQYARNEDLKSSLWVQLTEAEKYAVAKYNEEHQLA